jgi:hypothetical protein
MRRLLLVLTATWVTLAHGAALLDDLLPGDPIVEAKRASANGDRRALVIPMCSGGGHGEVLPGWPLKGDSDHVRALEHGRRPVTCADMHNEADFLRASKYAELYNRTLLETPNRK